MVFGAGEADAVADEEQRALGVVAARRRTGDFVLEVGVGLRGFVLGGVEAAQVDGSGMGEAWTSSGMSIQTGPGRPLSAR